MKCYDCGGEVAAGEQKCCACGCPAERERAAAYLEVRLRTARVESESALDQLGRARSALFAAALLSLVSAVIELVNAQGDGMGLALGGAMLLLTGGYAVLAFRLRKSPLILCVAGLVMSLLSLSSVLGIVIIGIVALSVWFAALYVKTTSRERELRTKIDKLK